MQIRSIASEGFVPYGKPLAGFSTIDFLPSLQATPQPDEGVVYVASDPTLEGTRLFGELQTRAFGGMPMQIGYCNGRNTKLNCLEYHRNSEVLVALTDTVLMVGLQSEMKNWTYDTSKVELFLVPAGQAVELYATTLHYAPCTAPGEDGFRVAICLLRGTNGPCPEGIEVGSADITEDRLLTACNKWLIAHADSDEAAQGAWVGLTGRNLDLAEMGTKPLKFTSIPNNPELAGLASWSRDVVYSTETGTPLTMQLLLPWAATDPAFADRRWPCVVFVQGSAWTFPDVGYELPQLSDFARKGYVVATLVHRSSKDGHKAPAFLEDVKTAVRFLRRNADLYRIDADRIGIWGTSSGGNTALLMGLTGDDPSYHTGEHDGHSDAVKTVVECFGPSDLFALFKNGIPEKDENGEPSIFTMLFGETAEEQEMRMRRMNPIDMVRPGKAYPPFLLLHGDEDELVPYDQSERMAERLAAHDVATELVRIEGAPHEGNFWSVELLGMVEDFLERTL